MRNQGKDEKCLCIHIVREQRGVAPRGLLEPQHFVGCVCCAPEGDRAFRSADNHPPTTSARQRHDQRNYLKVKTVPGQTIQLVELAAFVTKTNAITCCPEQDVNHQKN